MSEIRGQRIGDRGQEIEIRSQRSEVGSQRSEDRIQRKEERDYPVGAVFPDLPVPGVVPGSLSKVSRDLAIS